MKYIALLTFILICSCSKDSGSTLNATATILNTGDPAADGCGWEIGIDSLPGYHPDNLNDAFKQNGIKVYIKYNLTKDTFLCGGFALIKLPVIHILYMKKQ